MTIKYIVIKQKESQLCNFHFIQNISTKYHLIYDASLHVFLLVEMSWDL